MVSVIIPAYNCQSCIKRAIDSVLAQTFQCPIEIIVVDDGSTDNTARIVKDFGDKVNYIYQPSSGASVARNKGIAAAKGSWIAFLDADDQWLSDKLKSQMSLLEKNPSIKWCASNSYQTDGVRKSLLANLSKIKIDLDKKDYFENYFLAAAQKKCVISTPTMVIAKEIFEIVGNFQPDLIRGQDTDMWWRIAYQFPAIGYIAEPLAIIHLDVYDPQLAKRRLQTKTGANDRQLIARHIDLAVQHNMLEDFHPLAVKLLKNILLTTLYHGYGNDARITVKQFKEFFPWYWRSAAYMLTIFPKLTSILAKSAALLAYKLKFDSNVSRRWLHSKILKEKNNLSGA